MKKIRDIVLRSLNENSEYVQISPDVIGDINDVSFNKKFVRIDFSTTYGKELSLLVKYSDFNNWVKKNINNYKNMFSDFVKHFISKSKEVQGVNEIVDDNGDIMGSDDKPTNATNSMVAISTSDLEKVYKRMPKSTKYYSGAIGFGAIVW